MFCPFIKDTCKEEECVCWSPYFFKNDKGEEQKNYDCCYAQGWFHLSIANFAFP